MKKIKQKLNWQGKIGFYLLLTGYLIIVFQSTMTIFHDNLIPYFFSLLDRL